MTELNKKIQSDGDGMQALSNPSGTSIEACVTTIMIPQDMVLNPSTQKKDRVKSLYYTVELQQNAEVEDDLPHFGKPTDQMSSSKPSELRKNAKAGFEFFSANFTHKFSLELSKSDQVILIKVYA